LRHGKVDGPSALYGSTNILVTRDGFEAMSKSLDDFHRRVVEGWQLITAQSKGQNNLVVCHGGVIRMILAHILNVDYRQGSWYSELSIDYASLTRIEIPAHPNAQPVVRFINISSPLTFKTIFKESHD
jgi:broad specificity phosphatase PhoE